ncbi:hypothetical protein MTR67_030651 [Solanum verrucosum]|uniref:Uncharacterized protein n=1 Tax=Solanum verrucosum TaxID=315347 RepID=A0AAF0TY93_SOLVR|nr:hypothetical protein MTR67_030651 [Solanum verrucosum]
MMDNMIEIRSSQAPLKIAITQDRRKSFIKQIKIEKIYLSTECLIPIDQLEDFIIKIIEEKSESSSKFSLTYAKSYTKRNDNFEMHEGYQPPKLQQFDGKGNSNQHIVHFIETFNDAWMYGDYFLKLFFRYLKENAFN